MCGGAGGHRGGGEAGRLRRAGPAGRRPGAARRRLLRPRGPPQGAPPLLAPAQTPRPVAPAPRPTHPSLSHTDIPPPRLHFLSPEPLRPPPPTLPVRAPPTLAWHREGMGVGGILRQEESGWRGDVWSLGCCVLAMGTLTTPIGTRSAARSVSLSVCLCFCLSPCLTGHPHDARRHMVREDLAGCIFWFVCGAFDARTRDA